MKTILTIIFIFIVTSSFAQPCMDVELTKTNPSCIGLSDGTATVTVSGGTAPYTYNWSTGATTNSVSNLGNGSYTVTVSDAASCVITESFTIENAPVINITSNATQACGGSLITFFATQFLGGTNPQYQWQVNGVNVGIDDPTYADSTLNDGDVVTAIITSNDTCVSIPTATSNAITISILNAQQPVITQNGNQLSTVAASHHQWFLNGVPLANDTTQTITIDTIGDYTVMITDTNGCQATSAVFTVTTIGISLIEKINFNVYPVPANHFLNFNLSYKLYNAEIFIIDHLGKVVNTIKFPLINEKYSLNISGLDAGIYFIEIDTPDKKYYSKFIKK